MKNKGAKMKKINYKKLLFYIIITFIIGVVPSIPIFKNMNIYSSLNKPPLSPPKLVFPIAWSILYILMAISLYIVTNKSSVSHKKDKLIYFIQLVTNALRTPIFFGLKAYLLSYIWILLLIVFVIIMILEFYKINKVSAYIQIPYLLWLIFASYLNYGVLILN